MKGAEADIAAAQALVTQARVSLDRTIIRSPMDGVVIGRHVNVGETIAASVHAPILFTIGDLRRMRLLAEVPEGDVGGVQRGSQITFDIESTGGRALTGTVAEVRLSPQIAPATVPNAAAASTAPAATSSASPVATSGTAQPAGSPTSGTTAAPTSGQTTSSSSPAAPATSTQQGVAATGVVTYVAVIDVDAPGQDVPPGGTAMVTLAGSERTNAVRIPNNALTFAPSPDMFAAVDQHPPVLSRPDRDPAKRASTRKRHVWKFENNRFVPIAVETGIADDSWTELVSGDVRPGDRLVTAAAPVGRGRPSR